MNAKYSTLNQTIASRFQTVEHAIVSVFFFRSGNNFKWVASDSTFFCWKTLPLGHQNSAIFLQGTVLQYTVLLIKRSQAVSKLLSALLFLFFSGQEIILNGLHLTQQGKLFRLKTMASKRATYKLKHKNQTLWVTYRVDMIHPSW